MPRRLRFEIFRYNPEDPASEPHMQTFEIDEAPYMSLYIALNEIREKQDPSLQFDFACRSAICGSCGMMVNGKPVLGCRTQTSDLSDTVRLHPLPAFKLIGDLSVDTGTWFRGMVEKAEAWIKADKPFDRNAQEERMSDDLAQAIYEGERCIECGCRTQTSDLSDTVRLHPLPAFKLIG
ncbi:MAG: 2Fe-2S iron-sulfur cluster-binding protein, partial [Pseudomonadota bacterium]